LSFDAKKAVKHPIILISGDEATLRTRAVAAVLAQLEMVADDFDLETVDADQVAAAEWAARAATTPFLAERRVLIVRHLLRLGADRAKNAQLDRLPEHALLILVADEEIADEDKQRRLSTALTAWKKLVTTAGGHVADLALTVGTVEKEIRDVTTRYGKKISSTGIRLLVEMTGSSLSRALDEVDKVALFVGDAENIREADIRAVAVPSIEFNVFKVVDGVLKNDIRSALAQMKTLLSGTKDPDDRVRNNIVPQVRRALRLLWQAKLCSEAGVGPANAPESVTRQFPEKPNLGKEKAWTQNTYMEAARSLKRQRLVRCFAILADADARLKGGLPAFSAEETCERMLLEMAAVLHPTPVMR
jgi:DNA polymerase-3 subunit delta